MKIGPPSRHPFQAIPKWGYLVHEVARLLKRRFEEQARDHGLTLQQWRTLGTISMGGNNSQAALAATMDADPMTMSGILDRLEKRGLIVRAPDPTDSRVKLASITDEGSQLVERARDVGRSVLADALKGVSQDDRDALIRALGCIRENLQAEPAREKELQ